MTDPIVPATPTAGPMTTATAKLISLRIAIQEIIRVAALGMTALLMTCKGVQPVERNEMCIRDRSYTILDYCFFTLISDTSRIACGILFVLKMKPISGTYLCLPCFVFSPAHTAFERATLANCFLFQACQN